MNAQNPETPDLKVTVFPAPSAAPGTKIEKDEDPTVPTHVCAESPDCQCRGIRAAGDRLLGAAKFLDLYLAELESDPRAFSEEEPTMLAGALRKTRGIALALPPARR